MTTYAPRTVTAKSKRQLQVPTADAFAVGDNTWYMSDNNTNDKPNRGIPIPAFVPFKITSGRQVYAYSDYPVTITMVDA